MIPTAIIGFCLLQVAAPSTPPAGKVVTVDEERGRALLSAKRIYVESFGEDTISKTFQGMVVDAIGTTKRFLVTENKEKADLILKGAVLEKTSQEAHSLGSGTAVGGAAGGAGGFHAGHAAISDAQSSIETINDARAAVRLVSRDGDVVWSTTQESKGGKYKGAAADAAEKIIKQLLHDIERLEAPPPAPKSN